MVNVRSAAKEISLRHLQKGHKFDYKIYYNRKGIPVVRPVIKDANGNILVILPCEE